MPWKNGSASSSQDSSNSSSNSPKLLSSFNFPEPEIDVADVDGSVLRWEAKVATQLRQEPKMDPARKINLKKRLDCIINSFNCLKFRLSHGKDFANATIMSVDFRLLKLLDMA